MANLARTQDTPSTWEQLAADVETVIAHEREHARIVPAVEPLLARFLAAQTLPEHYCHPAEGRVATEHQDFTVPVMLPTCFPRMRRFTILSTPPKNRRTDGERPHLRRRHQPGDLELFQPRHQHR